MQDIGCALWRKSTKSSPLMPEDGTQFKHQFEFQLCHFHSGSLLVCLEIRWRMAQVRGSLTFAWQSRYNSRRLGLTWASSWLNEFLSLTLSQNKKKKNLRDFLRKFLKNTLANKLSINKHVKYTYNI